MQPLIYGIENPVYITYVIALKYKERIGWHMSPGGCTLERSTIRMNSDYYKFFCENNIQCERE